MTIKIDGVSKAEQRVLLSHLEDNLGRAKTFKSETAEEVAENLLYYRGEAPKKAPNECAGAVEPVVKQNVDNLTRELGTIFCNPKRETVAFLPQHRDDIQSAEEATFTVNNVLLRLNNGDKVFKEACKESAFAGVGFIAVSVDDEIKKVKSQEINGITQEALDDLLEELTLAELPRDVLDIVPEVENKWTDDDGLVYCDLFLTVHKKKPTIFTIPTEQAYFDNSAPSIQESTYFGYETITTLGELIDQGYKQEDLKGIELYSLAEIDDLPRYERQPTYAHASQDVETPQDELAQKVVVITEYIRTSALSKGKKLELVQAIRSGQTLLSVEPVDFIPVAPIVLDPILGSIGGHAIASYLKPFQDTATAALRGWLDGEVNRAYGRYTAVKGQYDRKALLHNVPGGVVEQNAPGMIDPFPYGTLGQGLKDVLSYTTQRALETSSGRDLTDLGISANTAPTTAAIIHGQSKIATKDIALNVLQGYKELVHLVYKALRLAGLPVSVYVNGESYVVDTSQWPERYHLQEDLLIDSDRDKQRALMLDVFNMSMQMAKANPALAQTLISEENAYKFLTDFSEASDLYEASTKYFTAPKEADPQLAQQQQQLQIQQQQLQNQLLQLQLKALELSNEKVEGEIEKAAQEIALKQNTAAKDIDKSSLEAAELQQEMILKQREADRKDKELQLKEEELRAKIEEIAAEIELSAKSGHTVNVGSNL